MKIPGFYEWEGLSCAARLGSMQSWQGMLLRRNKRCHLLPLSSWNMQKAPVKTSPGLTRAAGAVPSHPWGQQAKPAYGGNGDAFPDWCHHRERHLGVPGLRGHPHGGKISRSFPAPWLSHAGLPHSTGLDQCLGGTGTLLLCPGRSHVQHTVKNFLCFCVHKASIPTTAPHPSLRVIPSACWPRGLLPSPPSLCKH